MFPAGFPEVEEDRVIIFPASLPSTSFSSVGQQDGSSSVGEAPNRIVMSVFDWNFQPKGKQRPPPTSMGSADKYGVLSREILPLGQITFFAGVRNATSQQGAYFPILSPGIYQLGVARRSSSSIAGGDEFLCSGKLLSPPILAI